MTSAANAGRQAVKPATWSFAESYVPDTESGVAAREAATDLGIDAPSRGAAQVLTFLARAIGAKAVVEVGTGSGVATLALLQGMATDGVITTIDPEAEHQNVARRLVSGTGVRPQRLRTIAGAPLTVLPKLSDKAYDLVLVNGDRLEYPELVEQALRLLRSGGVLAVHHALLGGKVADQSDDADETMVVRDLLTAIQEMPDVVPVLLPVGDGLLAGIKG